MPNINGLYVLVMLHLALRRFELALLTGPGIVLMTLSVFKELSIHLSTLITQNAFRDFGAKRSPNAPRPFGVLRARLSF
jgi:hypothetical protein